MSRSLIAVFLLHFFLCVGISAVGKSAPIHEAQLQGISESGDQSRGHKAPEATSDADDHALLDDKHDLPDLLHTRSTALAPASSQVALIGVVVVQLPSAIVSPLRRPPRALGFFA